VQQEFPGLRSVAEQSRLPRPSGCEPRRVAAQTRTHEGVRRVAEVEGGHHHRGPAGVCERGVRVLDVDRFRYRRRGDRIVRRDHGGADVVGRRAVPRRTGADAVRQLQQPERRPGVRRLHHRDDQRRDGAEHRRVEPVHRGRLPAGRLPGHGQRADPDRHRRRNLDRRDAVDGQQRLFTFAAELLLLQRQLFGLGTEL